MATATKLTTNDMAALLGTAPRVLRQFLRSPGSTYAPVGSGSRYEFTERDIPTIQKRFADWSNNMKKAQNAARPATPARPKTTAPKPPQADIDAQVWTEEEEENGPVVLADMRDPITRRRVLATAREQEDRLMLLLMAAGLHVSQMGDAR